MNVGKHAASSMGWAIVEKWSTRLVSLAVLLILGRLLTPEQFGLVALATVFMTFLNVFVDQGFGRALVQRAEIDDIHSNTAFWISVAGSVAFGGLLVGTAPFIAAIVNEPELAVVIQVMSIGLILYAFSSVPQALLEREFGFRALARRRVVATTIGGILAVVAAAVGLGVWSLVIQVLVTAFVGVLMLWMATTWRPRFQVSLAAARDLWPTGFSMVGIELVGFLNSQSDKLIVGAALDATALGYYAFAMRIISIMIELFSSVLSSISLTTFSRLQHDNDALRRWLYRLTSISCVIAIPAFAVLAAVAQEAVPLIFGSQWGEAGLLVQMLCVLGAVNAIAVFDRSALVAVGRNRLALGLTFGQAIVGILFVVAALPFGVVGVAIAVSVRQLVWWPVRLWALRRALQIDVWKYSVIFLKPFAIGIVSAIAGYGAITWIWPLENLPWIYVLVGIAVTGLFLGGLGALFLRGSVRQVMDTYRSRRKGKQ